MKYVPTLLSAILAGVILSVVNIVQFCTNDTLVVSILVPAGFLVVNMFGLDLFTSKSGYLFTDHKNFEKRFEEIPFVLFGNLIGAWFTALILHSIYKEQFAIFAKDYATIEPLHILIKAFFCGILMFIAAHSYFRTNGSVSSMTVVFLLYSVVTVCNLNFFVNDMFFLAGDLRFNRNLFRLIFSMLGNFLGAIAFAWIYNMQKDKSKKRHHHHHHKHHSSHHHAKRDIETADESVAENSTEEK